MVNSALTLGSALIIIGLFTAFLIVRAWQVTQASGFASIRGLTILLMQCSLVLLPLAWALGLKRGTIAKCSNCRYYKFLWAKDCPHCAHENAGTVAEFKSLLPWRKGVVPASTRSKQPSARNAYRQSIPIMLLIMCLGSSSSDFHADHFTFSLAAENTATSEATIAEIKDYLGSIEDVRDWLNADGNEPLLLPERFRIVVSEAPKELKVSCYWLKWEAADAVGERIKTRIQEEFPKLPLSSIVDEHSRNHSYVYTNPITLPNFLDDDIHWVEE